MTIKTSDRKPLCLVSVAALLAASASGCILDRERTPGGLDGPRLVIPTDERAVVESEVAPRPISGGTLLALRDGVTVVAADSDRDRAYVADVASGTLLSTIDLGDGAEPGRAVQGTLDTVYLALRGTGEVATLDAGLGVVTARERVCAEPRGLAWDETLGQLHVACASGELVTLDAEGTVARTVRLEPDLRDVVLHEGRVLVSRLKTAELLEVSASGTVLSRSAPGTVDRVGFDETGETLTPMAPAIAWRAVATPSGETLIVHQRAMTGVVELEEPTPEQPTSYGGGGFDCQGIVQSALTIVGPGGETRTATLSGSVLPVDVAISTNGMIAVASAGIADPSAPRPFVDFPRGDDGFGGGDAPRSAGASLPPTGSVGVFFEGDVSDIDRTSFCRFDSFFAPFPQEPMVAVAFTPSTDPLLVAQSREPAELYVWSQSTGDFKTIRLDESSRRDTGHDLFHRDTGAGIACASCHPEGAEDGHTWEFSEFGRRRTQPLNVGLAGTAPFHWDGTLSGIDTLMEEVLVGRMGGAHQSEPRMNALQDWLFSIEAPEPMVAEDDPAAVRGRQVFVDAGCETCHSGAALTNNATVDVGTGGLFQVPSLVGVGYRAPFIHTGCADTLAERFDPSCGGAAHGAVSGLSDAQIADMVAYLETL